MKDSTHTYNRHSDDNNSSSSNSINNNNNSSIHREEIKSESESETDEYMNLFSSTLRSLVADAAAIRQISDMADILKGRNQPKKGVVVDETSNNNNNHGSLTPSTASTTSNAAAIAAQSVAENLVKLDDLVTGFEHKIGVLRQILNEEKNALHRFETTLRQEADDQSALVQGLLAVLESESDITNTNNNDDDNNEVRTSLSFSSSLESNSTIRNSYQQDSLLMDYRHDDADFSISRSTTDSWEEDDALVGSQPISNQPVPQQQQQQQQKSFRPSVGSHGSSSSTNTIRSTDSGSFTRRKGLLKSTKFSSNSNNSNNNNNNSSNNGNSRSNHSASTHKATTPYKRTVGFKDDAFVSGSGSNYKNGNNSNNETKHTPGETNERPTFVPVTDQELGTQQLFGPHMCRYDINEALEEIQTVLWNQLTLTFRGRNNNNNNNNNNQNNKNSHRHRFAVSEQELRENCAFFRHGESTARSTLQLLCSLKRLKQVPSKNSEVKYVCLFGV